MLLVLGDVHIAQRRTTKTLPRIMTKRAGIIDLTDTSGSIQPLAMTERRTWGQGRNPSRSPLNDRD